MQLTEAQIRRIIQQEIAKSNNSSRFSLSAVTDHVHNGIDSPKIKEENLIQSVSVSGNISFSSSDEYTIYLNSSFTPSSILVYGNVVGSVAELYMTFGTASLVPSFYLQPDTTRTVVTGNVQYPFIDPNLNPVSTVPLQSSIYIGAESTSTGNGMHSLSSEGHVVNVFYGSDIKARLTITEYTRSFIKMQTTIDPGWSINANFVIT